MRFFSLSLSLFLISSKIERLLCVDALSSSESRDTMRTNTNSSLFFFVSSAHFNQLIFHFSVYFLALVFLLLNVTVACYIVDISDLLASNYNSHFLFLKIQFCVFVAVVVIVVNCDCYCRMSAREIANVRKYYL